MSTHRVSHHAHRHPHQARSHEHRAAHRAAVDSTASRPREAARAPRARHSGDAFEAGPRVDHATRLGAAPPATLPGSVFSPLNAPRPSGTAIHDALATNARLAGQGIQPVMDAFDSAREEVDHLNATLGTLVSQYGEGLGSAAVQRAVAAFHDEHAEAYQRFEDAGRALVGQLGVAGAIFSHPDRFPSQTAFTQAARVFDALPSLGQTRAGREELAAALIDQGAGRPSFLDGLPTALANSSHDDAWTESLRTTLVEAAGVGVGAAAGGTGDDGPDAALLGLTRNAGVLGVDPAHLDQITEHLTELMEAGSAPDATTAVRALVSSFDGAGEALGEASALGQAFRGLGVVVGGISSAVGLSSLGEQPLAERIATIAEALHTGTSGVSLGLNALSAAGALSEGSRLVSLTGALGPAGGALDAVVAVTEAFSAHEAFSEGHVVAGASHTASALGSTTIALATGISALGLGAEALPAVGTAVGTVLIGAGAVLGHLANVQASNVLEGPAEDFLTAAGVDPAIAHELRNADPSGRVTGGVLNDLSRDLGITPRALFDWLRDQPAQDVKAIVEAAHEVLPNDGDDWRATDARDASAGLEPFETHDVDATRPHSVHGLAVWLARQHFAPIPGARTPAEAAT